MGHKDHHHLQNIIEAIPVDDIRDKGYINLRMHCIANYIKNARIGNRYVDMNKDARAHVAIWYHLVCDRNGKPCKENGGDCNYIAIPIGVTLGVVVLLLLIALASAYNGKGNSM